MAGASVVGIRVAIGTPVTVVVGLIERYDILGDGDTNVAVGTGDPAVDGAAVGMSEGTVEIMPEGTVVIVPEGTVEIMTEGTVEITLEGATDPRIVGLLVGIFVGLLVGIFVGVSVGDIVCRDGDMEGENVGTSVCNVMEIASCVWRQTVNR